ncbi:hypothetical protein PHOBOS_45 [Erwinia phage vB_EamM_Phobos]|uniref:hypothetical protein n=1 Tax=Erwinia phage vB_EamM_Phobos TaxID=1883377 RepID=UPI00081CB3A7|nr:hypothetical protein BIZ79_gp045 [Erwinia phage vB_EamM_Phobos]ANZ50235.1 hypothetical protein PHOBOS_45 [Erwinia phage vB_EamM_Phobos]
MGNKDNRQSQASGEEKTPVLETTAVETTSQESPRPDLTPAVETTAQVAPIVGVNAEEQYDLKLLGELLEEYSNNSGMHVDLNSTKSKVAFSKLHHAFRLLFKMRGQAFKSGFAALINVINDATTKAFHPKVVNYHLSNLSPEEQQVFIIFINYAGRFARFDNKSKFSKNTNVSRLTELVVDPELKGLLNEVFLVTQ